MSARDDYPLLALPDVALAPIKLDGQNAAALREIDDLRADHTEAILLFGAATTELSALKARRCDGCAHAEPSSFVTIAEFWCGRWSSEVRVPASHSCAAWTPKEPQP